LKVQVGEVRFELYHGKGETDDGTWVWFPDFKGILFPNFFFSLISFY